MADELKKIEPVALVEALADDGLAEYLLDTDSVNELITWIHEETGIPKTYLTPTFKLLGPLVVKAGQKAATWGAGKVTDSAQRALTHLPFYNQIAGWLVGLKQRLSDKAADKKLLDGIIAGRRPPSDAEYGKDLSRELQLHLKALTDLDELKGDVRNGFDELISLLHPQPPLWLTTLDPEADAGRMRLHYQAQRVPFVGRQEEKKQLSKWLASEAAFSWWIITGSGGQGKSRLALELCRRHGNGWRVGFLPREHGFTGWDNWQPDRPTLMVIDYASGKEEELRSIISALYGRSTPLDWPVRLLLIEREAGGKWWDDFTAYSGEGGVVLQSKFADAMRLGSMSKDDIWLTIRFILEGHGVDIPDDAEGLLKNLEEIDPEFRPLYAAFAAEALALGNDIRGWDKTKLLSLILDREQREFWPKDVTPVERNLLCLATMLGGLPVELLTRMQSDGSKAKHETSHVHFDPDRYAAMSGKVVQDMLAPLEPDIFGEFFVLEHLAPKHQADTRWDEMRRTAWLGDPFGFWTFLDRTARDFHTHMTFPNLIKPATWSLLCLVQWSRLAVNLTYYYGSVGELKSAKQVFTQLHDLYETQQDEHELREYLATAALNLQAAYGDKRDMEASLEFFDFLKSLYEGQPNDPAVRLRLAKAAVNLTVDHGLSGHIDAVRSHCEYVLSLHRSHTHDAALADQSVYAVYNLAVTLNSLGRKNQARFVIRENTDLLRSRDLAQILGKLVPPADVAEFCEFVERIASAYGDL